MSPPRYYEGGLQKAIDLEREGEVDARESNRHNTCECRRRTGIPATFLNEHCTLCGGHR